MTPARILAIAALIVVSFAIYLPGYVLEAGKVVSETRFLMGTIVQIKVALVPNKDAREVRQITAKAFEEIKRVEGVFSVFYPDSEISQINRLKAGERLKISSEAFDLIKKSIEYNKKTEGAFDITVKPLVDLWKRAKAAGKIPTPEEIEVSLARVGSNEIILDDAEKTISFRKDGMALDLGGVAKGYATARAVGILKASGIRNAIVNSGGDMYCLGKKSDREFWKVGIQHPRNRNRMFLELRLKDKAVDTSGDYEKYFILDGRRYSHIIDPRTGYPVGDNIVSASVIADDSAMADILATALCVLGREGLMIVETMSGADAMIIVKVGDALKMVETKNFKKLCQR